MLLPPPQLLAYFGNNNGYMLKKLLIANRGEIACRIIRTAKKLNVQTVAIYSEIDATALHVQLADESYCVGPAASTASYLNVEKIITIAKAAQVEAIHPGYGFLSEDAEFAEQCQQAGLIFIGPSAHAIRIMGDKNLAKNTMIAAGVPVAPGYHDEAYDIDTLTAAAKKIGLPVLVKASAGGGGKGMRLVENLEQLATAVESAMREAQASFGDSRIFLEKYLTRARHIEVQILFDQHGHGLTLFDRDCSTQRRHQKVIEEAPAPGLADITRQRMAVTALRAGEAIQYQSAGTIEFLVDENENFYFMEMNTRLQVEHPVTEMITGLDLVEWQLRIASGEKLTLQADKIKARGHAIEARLYAENPQNQFMPSAGALTYFQLPATELPTVRVDNGFNTGDQVSIYYDPLLAKLVAWGEDRRAAINTLQRMLSETAVVGIHTNLTLLHRITENSAFLAGKVNTQFIAEHQQSLLALPEEPPELVLAAAAAVIFQQQRQEITQLQQNNTDIYSPWQMEDGWRANTQVLPSALLWQGQKSWRIAIKISENSWQFQWNQHLLTANLQLPDNNRLLINHHAITYFYDNQQLQLFYSGEQWTFFTLNPAKTADSLAKQPGLQAPMPGTVIEILVKPGQSVQAGERLLVMEAMKMEHTLAAPHAGKIQEIFYQTGDRVSSGSQLLTFES
jgi:3-methylcrotonyl-CoA carboxylase alpha subunit